ncbi:MAG: amino acid ABC transporter ATP-binding protein [Terracoccus sp.]
MSVGNSRPSAAATDTPVIRLRGVSKRFGDQEVLHRIDLDVDPGEVVVLLGPSGSGKSTLCRCINRLETASEGTVEISGRELPQEGRALAAVRAEVGMVFQSFNLFGHRTALQNITMAPVKVRGLSRKDAEQRARRLLERVGIPDKADRFPAELSGGQQQRVAIARALAMEPRALLFDEPTSALDPEMINEVLDVMIELARDGMTMLVVTHEMGFARRAADRVVFMDEGHIIEQAPPEQFFAAPQTDRSRDFLSKILSH